MLHVPSREQARRRHDEREALRAWRGQRRHTLLLSGKRGEGDPPKGESPCLAVAAAAAAASPHRCRTPPHGTSTHRRVVLDGGVRVQRVRKQHVRSARRRAPECGAAALGALRRAHVEDGRDAHRHLPQPLGEA
eukprot:2117058-Prymnesium_polylepis.1